MKRMKRMSDEQRRKDNERVAANARAELRLRTLRLSPDALSLTVELLDRATAQRKAADSDEVARLSETFPHSWCCDLYKVVVRISEIEADPAPPPPRLRFDLNASFLEMVAPLLHLIGRDRERNVDRA